MGRSSASSSSSGLLGWISPRTATLAIAVLGIIIHLNNYSWLGTLSSTLPDVPERGLTASPLPPASVAFVPSADRFSNSTAKADQLIDLDVYAKQAAADGTANNRVYLPEWVAEAKAYLRAQGLSFVPTPGNEGSGNPKTNANGRASEASAPSRYNDASDPSGISYQVIDDGAEDVERMQWDALRLVIGTLRWYILLSVICCCAGVVGVLRSNLLLSRLFVIHSFLDFLLSTLSLFALAIVCTYPTVRAHLCDEFGSGEVQSWFTSSKAGRIAGSSTNSAQALVNGAASSHSARIARSGTGSDVTVDASGWETFLDGVFASENCEESFRTTVVPLLMVFGLFFTAVRLQCFFLVQRFYASLLRSKVYQYGYGAGGLESGISTPMSQLSVETGRERRWKESKLID